jgi:REP element-mobilizing transposase RayT
MASTLTNLLLHVVFSTKDRRGLITIDLQENLYPYIGGIIRGEKGAPIAIGGTKDHIHILAEFPASISVSDMLRRIKGNSSKWIKDKGRPFAWQRGYAAFSVSQSLADRVKTYIQGQEEHHQKNSFQDELISLLKMHGIEYDEKYIWS